MGELLPPQFFSIQIFMGFVLSLCSLSKPFHSLSFAQSSNNCWGRVMHPTAFRLSQLMTLGTVSSSTYSTGTLIVTDFALQPCSRHH